MSGQYNSVSNKHNMIKLHHNEHRYMVLLSVDICTELCHLDIRMKFATSRTKTLETDAVNLVFFKIRFYPTLNGKLILGPAPNFKANFMVWVRNLSLDYSTILNIMQIQQSFSILSNNLI